MPRRPQHSHMATITPGSATSATRPLRESAPRRALTLRREHGVLAAILLLSGLLEFVRLSQNGFANVYYSAAVKSMLRSWHNFFFVVGRPQRPDHRRQAAAGAVAAGGEREDVRLLAAQPAGPRGDLRGARGARCCTGIVAPRFGHGRRAGQRVRARGVPVVRRGLARQRGRPAADPADARGVRRGAGGDRLRAAALAGAVRRCSSGWRSTRRRSPRSCACRGSRSATSCAPPDRCAGASRSSPPPASCCSRWRRRGPLVVDLTPASQRPFVGSTSHQLRALSSIFGYNGFGRVGGAAGRPGQTKKYRGRRHSRRSCGPASTSRAARSSAATSRAHPRERAAAPAPARAAALRAPPASQRRRGRRPRQGGPVREHAPHAGADLRHAGSATRPAGTSPLAVIGLIALVLAVRRRAGPPHRRAVRAGRLVPRRAAHARLLERASSTPTTPPRSGPGSPRWSGAGAVALADARAQPQRPRPR